MILPPTPPLPPPKLCFRSHPDIFVENVLRCLSAFDLKTYSDVLVPLICRFVNESLLSGSFPLQCKEVVVPPSFLKRKKKALMQTVSDPADLCQTHDFSTVGLMQTVSNPADLCQTHDFSTVGLRRLRCVSFVTSC